MTQVQYFTDTIYPMGRMILDPDKSGEFIIDDIPQLLGADAGSTFIQTGESKSLTDEFMRLYTYQQFHEGIEVVGGGYSIYATPNVGTDPCAQAYAISPNMGTNINVSSSPNTNENEIFSILGTENVSDTKLAYHHNLLSQGEYFLVWKGYYDDNGTRKYFYIDADKGDLLKSGPANEHLSAPTQVYGTQDMDDTNDNGVFTLESEDGRIKTYDLIDVQFMNGTVNFIDMYIPNTNNNSGWTPMIAHPSVYQTHFAAREVLNTFIALGIDARLDVMHNGVLSGNNLNNKVWNVTDNDGNPDVNTDADIYNNYIDIGVESGRSKALIDIVGHEYAHNYLRNLLTYADNSSSQALNEGFSDIIGIYVESVYQAGAHDWPMGDDDDPVREGILDIDDTERDASHYHEDYNCVPDVSSSGTDRYVRGYPITRWFYKITDGASGVPALGIETSIRIVIDALNVMNNPDADYADFREAVELTVDLNFGRCSDESTAVRRAFFQICVGSYQTCDWTTTVPQSICIDKVNGLYACAINGFEDFTYRWTFPSSDWNVEGAGSTSTVNGRCARATNIPDYPYYPYTVTIRVRNMVTEESKDFNVILRDCSNSSGGSGCTQANINEQDNELSTNDLKEIPVSIIQVFDITGRIIYKGIPEEFQQNSYQIDGLYIIVSFDENGNFLSSKKMINLY